MREFLLSLATNVILELVSPSSTLGYWLIIADCVHSVPRGILLNFNAVAHRGCINSPLSGGNYVGRDEGTAHAGVACTWCGNGRWPQLGYGSSLRHKLQAFKS